MAMVDVWADLEVDDDQQQQELQDIMADANGRWSAAVAHVKGRQQAVRDSIEQALQEIMTIKEELGSDNPAADAELQKLQVCWSTAEEGCRKRGAGGAAVICFGDGCGRRRRLQAVTEPRVVFCVLQLPPKPSWMTGKHHTQLQFGVVRSTVLAARQCCFVCNRYLCADLVIACMPTACCLPYFGHLLTSSFELCCLLAADAHRATARAIGRCVRGRRMCCPRRSTGSSAGSSALLTMRTCRWGSSTRGPPGRQQTGAPGCKVQ